MTTESMEVSAHAKVNLTLEVLGKRSDGFHNLASVMQTLELHDSIRLEAAADVSLSCDVARLSGEDNLALRAARALKEAGAVNAGARILLTKRIPIAGGLGGGSSDAAAVLIGLNRLWRLEWPVTRLSELANRLGSDVPFFLYGGTAIVQGRGDEVVQIPPAKVGWFVILAPDIELTSKTGKMFSLITPDQYTRGVLSHKLAGRIRGGGDAPSQFFFNAFDAVADRAMPELRTYRDGFRSVGAREVTLCGAGPGMFALAPSREIGLAWQLLLQRKGWRAYLTSAWWPSAKGITG
ncbi:MAG: 4-(cytidine 5'-diphospho)-2-C-methyl-D-erythritol kinase [Chloroflexi bacterium]|nr:4-(cytidine 5'-diphospho)-2-C-methyl-D-erythritol kinase [Chloroflexota bacterium]